VTILSDRPITSDRIPVSALWLGWAGVLPFLALSLSLLLPPVLPVGRAELVFGVIAYGAVILSFLGGVRWGAVLRLVPADTQTREFALSVLPSLVGWMALLVSSRPLAALALLAASHVIQGFADVRAAQLGLVPVWYARLRVQLASAATTALTIASIAIAA
jgi:hypothetical protein